MVKKRPVLGKKKFSLAISGYWKASLGTLALAAPHSWRIHFWRNTLRYDKSQEMRF
jgi:hypothetical protein